MANDKSSESNKASQGTVQDSPGVLVFPPLLPLGTLLLGFLLNRVRPWSLFASSTQGLPLRIVAAVFALTGALLVIWGNKTMVRAGTNVPPNKPTLTIVTAGPFRFTRNPLYLGGTLIYLALALGLGSVWLLLLLVPMLVVLHWGIVHREERYLETKFGEVYRAYKVRVPRWI